MTFDLNSIRNAAIAAALVSIAGCATKPAEPTLADAMRVHSEDQRRQSEAKKELARDWERGNELAEDGRKLVARGEKRVEEAEEAMQRGLEEIERGNEQIVEGEALKTESEQRFRERFPELQLDRDIAER